MEIVITDLIMANLSRHTWHLMVNIWFFQTVVINCFRRSKSPEHHLAHFWRYSNFFCAIWPKWTVEPACDCKNYSFCWRGPKTHGPLHSSGVDQWHKSRRTLFLSSRLGLRLELTVHICWTKREARRRIQVKLNAIVYIITFRYAIYGDLGNINARSLGKIQRLAQDGDYDLIFHNGLLKILRLVLIENLGDFAYDMNDKDGKFGDEFMRQIEPAAAYVPYMISVGNHDRYYNYSHITNRFTMPGTDHNLFYR